MKWCGCQKLFKSGVFLMFLLLQKVADEGNEQCFKIKGECISMVAYKVINSSTEICGILSLIQKYLISC